MERKEIIEIFNRYMATEANDYEKCLTAMLNKLNTYKQETNDVFADEIKNKVINHAVFVASKHPELQFNEMQGWDKKYYRVVARKIYDTAPAFKTAHDYKALTPELEKIADMINNCEAIATRILLQLVYFKTFCDRIEDEKTIEFTQAFDEFMSDDK